MLEWYKGFIPSNKILFLGLPGFPGKLRLCKNSCSYHKTCTNVDPLEKVLIVELGLNKPETMLEQ